MKKTGWLFLILPILLVVLPLGYLPQIPAAQPVAGKIAVAEKSAPPFRLYRHETGKTETVSARDYLCGVVSAEMPASYEPEALKAQTVAAYTFALRRQKAAEEQKREYDISDDYTVDQAYTDADGQAAKWGDKTAEYQAKIAAAVDSVLGQTLQYDGELALTAYCGMSGGMTEAAADVWGKELPYLVAVDSSADKAARTYRTSYSFSPNELAERLSDTVTFSGEPGEWFGNFSRTASGGVKEVELCGTPVSGQVLRQKLELCSAMFEVTFAENTFTVVCCGHGHGVGMSQNGANEMAKTGADYKTILAHYYPGCDLVKA